MFPTLKQNAQGRTTVPNSSTGYDRMVADNTTKMVEILQAVVKSNENLNSKTDKLLIVSEHMMQLSQNMSKVSEQMMLLNEENIKWLKRLDKRMYFMNQGLAKQPASPDRPLQKSIDRERDIEREFEKEIDNSSKKAQERVLTHDGRFKMFEEPTPPDNILRRESDVAKLGRISVQFSSSYIAEIKAGTVDLAKINAEVATWVGDLFRQITSFTYDRYINSVYSEEEARLVFCESLILNSLTTMSWFREQNRVFWSKNRFQILRNLNTCSKKILGFLKTKVPRNKKNFKSLQFENLVERVNNSQDPRYDILKNTGLRFELKKGKDVHYVKQIKMLFNKLITEVEKEYPQFLRKMVFIFNGQQGHNDKVKYLIGKKFKDNVPLFTDQQLNTLNFKCKSPEILRILIKWLEEMEDLLKNPGDYIFKKKAFKSFKKGTNESVPASESIRKAIVNQIKEATLHEKGKFDKLMDILLDLNDNVGGLVSIKPQSSQFLDLEDIKAIKFSQLISESLPFLAVSRIEMIVGICRSLQMIGQPTSKGGNDSGNQQETKSGLLEFFDLLTFSVFDLLRCKCIGNKKDIQAIYQRLTNQPYLEIIRVKNRLDTPLNDIMINCKIKNSPIICEIQMLITNQLITQKSTKNEHFNHFLYQLQRSKFGPLCEACIIINDSDPRMQYIGELKKIKMKLTPLTKEQKQNLRLIGPKKQCYNKHPLLQLDHSLPFICSLCSIFNKQFSSSFDSVYCEECNLSICPRCLMDNLDMEGKKQNFYLKSQELRNVKKFFKDNIYQIKSFDKEKKLSDIIKEVLKDNNCKYCLLVSYCQGVISKKGFKLAMGDVVPTYFTMTKKRAMLVEKDKYDIIALFKEEEIELMSVKDIIKAGQIELTNSTLSKESIEQFAIKERINFRCIQDDNFMLVLDFQETDESINEVVRDLKLQNIIKECKTFKNTTLDISSNNLKDIQILKKESANLNHVLTVVADENDITSLDEFWKLENLKKLSLKNNEIKDYQTIDIKNQNFIDLFLAYNQFSEFPLIKAPFMTRVSFKKNKLVDISKLAQSEMPLLEELGLADNKITTLPKMNLPSIKKLVLSGNKIKDFSILNEPQIQTVKSIELDSNQITEIPVLHLPELMKLSIKKNQISSIVNLGSSTLNSLSTLAISKNRISEMPKLSLPELKILDLSQNKLTSLANISSNQFPSLLELKMNHNQIIKVSEIAFDNLETLDLGFNQIEKLSEPGTEKTSYFFKSKLPNIISISLALNNKFKMKQVVLMEIERWFTTVRHIE